MKSILDLGIQYKKETGLIIKENPLKYLNWLEQKYLDLHNKTADKCNVKNCAYHVITGNLEQIVIAENIASACDKLDKLGCSNYEFMSSASFEIIE